MTNIDINVHNSKGHREGARRLAVPKELATEELHDRIEKFMSHQHLLNNKLNKPEAMVTLLDTALKIHNL